ncbi:hypothetical protein RO3G_13896 [Rhizopus delemar RA 99-880]|uniref:Uncharacterized protein n=1 Tax=Rhizopus delemar (strain RA 99-880 / ATCC MYA-4621 / FGSC 9543 / NRRL 43880) TaxID=246409 RepID=I1CL55_RHIO9|nr:hypothetical protein RO3G_13896 [Rhizopus delemar RA 99-880]|eukprot:EIE89185.1 hypothetical protein RO3G_13896 [Rhizopus delemar RA 99-880]
MPTARKAEDFHDQGLSGCFNSELSSSSSSFTVIGSVCALWVPYAGLWMAV